MKKVCVYTGIFAESVPLDKPGNFKRIHGWDYIMFTNLEPSCFGDTSWTINKVDLPDDLSLRRKWIYANRYYKWHPQVELAEYDIVIYVDGFQVPNANKDLEWRNHVKSLMQMPSISLMQQRHNLRNCIYNELNEVVIGRKDNLEFMIDVNKFLQQKTYPRNNGLYWNGCFILKNKCPVMKVVFQSLWEDMCSLTYRDQVLYAYELWKHSAASLLKATHLESMLINLHDNLHHIYV